MMADLDMVLGQHVENEAAEKLLGGEWLSFHRRAGAREEVPEAPVFSGFNLFDKSMGFKNRTTAGGGAHHEHISGGEMRFSHDGRKLFVKVDPARNAELVSFPAATTRQIYHMLATDAELTVEEKGATTRVPGQMILESCWVGL